MTFVKEQKNFFKSCIYIWQDSIAEFYCFKISIQNSGDWRVAYKIFWGNLKIFSDVIISIWSINLLSFKIKSAVRIYFCKNYSKLLTILLWQFNSIYAKQINRTLHYTNMPVKIKFFFLISAKFHTMNQVCLKAFVSPPY